MRKITVGTKTSMGFLLLLSIFIGVVVFVSLESRRLQVDSSFLQKEIYPVLQMSHKLKMAIVQTQQWLTDISATRAAKGYADGYDEAAGWAKTFRETINEVKKRLPAQEAELNGLLTSYEEFYKMGKQMAQAYIDGGPVEGNKMMDEFDGYAENLTNKFQKFLEERESVFDNNFTDLNRKAGTMFKGAVVAGAIGIIIGILLAVYIVFSLINSFNRLKKLSSPMAECSSYLDHASTRITQLSQKLSSGAIEQAASLEETSSAMEQIAAQSKQNADNASNSTGAVKEMAKMVKQTSDNAGVANNLANESRTAVEEGAKSMEKIAGSMMEIKTDSDKITDIIEVINEITHQTKMLATNAAIEAARAGDQGKGFAVVADEVSKLAENSKTSAKEISTLIKESAQKAQAGSEMAEQGQDVMKKILEKSIKVADLISEITAASEEQSHKVSEVEEMVESINKASDEQANGIDQVTKAITQMDCVTQQNADDSGETASAAEELNTKAASLKEIVGELTSIVGESDHQDDKTAKHTKVQETKKLPVMKRAFDKRVLEPVKYQKQIKPLKTGNSGMFITPSDEIPMRDDFKEF